MNSTRMLYVEYVMLDVILSTYPDSVSLRFALQRLALYSESLLEYNFSVLRPVKLILLSELFM